MRNRITDARYLVKDVWLVMKWHWCTTMTGLIRHDMPHTKEGFLSIWALRGTKGSVKIVRHGGVDEPHRCAMETKMRNQALVRN